MEYVHEVIEFYYRRGWNPATGVSVLRCVAPFGADLLVFSDCVLGVE